MSEQDNHKLTLAERIKRAGLDRLHEQPVEDICRLSFGRHRGKALGDVPFDYLMWLVTSATIDDLLRSDIEAEMDCRVNGIDANAGFTERL